MTDVLLMLGVVVVVNLMPAFGPPTWTVLVIFLLKYDIAEPILVVGGAAAAASGRFVLAQAFRRLAPRLPEHKRRDLDAVGAVFTEKRGGRYGMLGLFLLSPLPSTPLFEAAGLTEKVQLVPVTLAFFAGRLVTYSLYVGGASAAQKTLGSALQERFTSGWAIAIQLGLVAVLAAFVMVPWAKLLHREPDTSP